MPVFVFIISLVGLWWVLEAAAWKWSSRSFYDPCSKTRKGPGGPSNAWGVLGTGGCRTDVHIHWLLPARNGSFHFWISSPNIHWIFQRGGTGMSSCRRRRSCSLGCVSPPCPFCTPLEKPESFLWNVAQGCFFLQNGSELVQFSCKTFSCLRGPLFKNKGT